MPDSNASRGVRPPGTVPYVISFFVIFVFSFVIDLLHTVTNHWYSINTIKIGRAEELMMENKMNAYQRKRDSYYGKDYEDWAYDAWLLSGIFYWTMLFLAVVYTGKACGCNCGDDCCNNGKGSWAQGFCCLSPCPAGLVLIL